MHHSLRKVLEKRVTVRWKAFVWSWMIWAMLFFLEALLVQPVQAKPGPGQDHLELEIRDEQGDLVAARVRLWDAQGAPHPVLMDGEQPVLIHPREPDMGVVVPGRGRIVLIPGRQTLRLERGTEYEPVEIAVGQDRGHLQPLPIRLHRWANMQELGWWSGDTHVHRLPEDVPMLMEAADLHVAPTITRWNDRSSLDEWPDQPLYSLPDQRAYSVNNCEDERQWGAALLLNLRSPVQLYSRQDHPEYPGPVEVWNAARRLGAYIDHEKLIWWESPVAVTLLPPDSVGVTSNHFLEEGMLAREAWGRPRDRDRYPGQEGFAQYTLDLYYTYLSAGFRLPASAGSANGVLSNPLGYNRSYVYLGQDFSYSGWFEGQREGRNFVTNGPMLLVKVDGNLPGTVLEEVPDEVPVEIEARSSQRLKKVEIVVDGEVVASFDPVSSNFLTNVRVPVRDGGWLAVRCFEDSPKTIRFAHTSPFYFGSIPRRDQESIQYLVDWIEAEIARLQRVPAENLTAEERQELIAVCRRALSKLGE